MFVRASTLPYIGCYEKVRKCPPSPIFSVIGVNSSHKWHANSGHNMSGVLDILGEEKRAVGNVCKGVHTPSYWMLWVSTVAAPVAHFSGKGRTWHVRGRWRINMLRQGEMSWHFFKYNTGPIKICINLLINVCYNKFSFQYILWKSRIRETLNLLTDTDSRTNTKSDKIGQRGVCFFSCFWGEVVQKSF